MQPESQSCNSCDYEITKSQRSLTCNICLNHYHNNRHCLRLASYDLSVTDYKFTCYQCIDVSFPFHNIDVVSFQANNETDRNELFERNVINNLAEFNPYQEEVSMHNGREILDLRSIRNKFDALMNYLNSLDHKFSIIALTETWINNNDGDNFEIPGYNSTKLVRQNKIGGGISIFTRDDLNVKLRNDLVPENNTGEIETILFY